MGPMCDDREGGVQSAQRRWLGAALDTRGGGFACLFIGGLGRGVRLGY